MRAALRGAPRGAASLIALFLAASAGCGGDVSTTGTTAPAASTQTQSTPSTQTQAQTQTGPAKENGGITAPNENPGENGQPGPSSGGTRSSHPSKPDSQTSDAAPQPNTPQSKFEHYCDSHPGACG